MHPCNVEDIQINQSKEIHADPPPLIHPFTHSFIFSFVHSFMQSCTKMHPQSQEQTDSGLWVSLFSRPCVCVSLSQRRGTGKKKKGTQEAESRGTNTCLEKSSKL
mmetsp:Transcript_38913/g.76497  ORF Transcript_38913/g.76497 Transcript_38913/m.76497 type:complete len:105 (+) Transcript_38913:955-1269(+)